jgi:hypothetical protein
MKTFFSLCAAILFAAAISAPAAAVNGLTVYTSRAAFMAAIHGAATDTFDDSWGDDNPTELDRSVGGYSYRAWLLQQDTLYRAGDEANGSLSDFGNAGDIILTDFTGGVNAVGGDFFNTDENGLGLPLTRLTVVAWTATQNPQPYENLITANVFHLYSETGFQFIGFTWTGPAGAPILMFDTESDDHSTWPTLDNLTLGIANPVPEPATWALALIGFGAVGCAMRRRGMPAIA